MSKLSECILRRLTPKEEEPTRQISITLSASQVEKMRQIAKIMSEVTGQRITQSMLYADAVDAFIAECLSTPEISGEEMNEPET